MFDHLVPFSHTLVGHGEDGADIVVRISYTSHVFSQSLVEHTDPFDFRDKNESKRRFCLDRYTGSLALHDLCRDMINRNLYTFISRDRNSVSNLTVVGDNLTTGPHYAIFYTLFPSRLDGYDVELQVRSAYERHINFENIGSRTKTCLLYTSPSPRDRQKSRMPSSA